MPRRFVAHPGALTLVDLVEIDASTDERYEGNYCAFADRQRCEGKTSAHYLKRRVHGYLTLADRIPLSEKLPNSQPNRAGSGNIRKPGQRLKMKKPFLKIEEEQPKNIQRADIAPTSGYAMVVDGRFKTQFSEEYAVQRAAKELLERFPMLQIEIYDAASKRRATVK